MAKLIRDHIRQELSAAGLTSTTDPKLSHIYDLSHEILCLCIESGSPEVSYHALSIARKLVCGDFICALQEPDQWEEIDGIKTHPRCPSIKKQIHPMTKKEQVSDYGGTVHVHPDFIMTFDPMVRAIMGVPVRFPYAPCLECRLVDDDGKELPKESFSATYLPDAGRVNSTPHDQRKDKIK